MKRILSHPCSAIILALLLVSIHSSGLCQQVRRFELELGLGKGESSKSSLFYLEPKYLLNSGNKLGLRFEAFKIESQRTAISFSLNDQFYFLKQSNFASEIHPFIGFGVGVLFPSHSNTAYPLVDPSGGWYYARIDGDTFRAQMVVYPRFGVDFRRFTLAFDYNLMYRRVLTITYYDPISHSDLPPSQFYRSDNYFAIKAGYRFFGPKRNK